MQACDSVPRTPRPIRILTGYYGVVASAIRPTSLTARHGVRRGSGYGRLTAPDLKGLCDYADLVVLAVPWRARRSLPLERLADRIVVDVMSYWRPVDGLLAEFEDRASSSGEIVQDGLAR